MPRSKKAGRKGHHNGVAFGGKKSGNQASSSAFGKAPLRGEKVFTLAEEAQNTGRQHNFWDTDQRLRHTKVNFISAGALDSSKPKIDDSENSGEPDFALADMTLDSTGEDIVEVFEEEEPVTECVEGSKKDAQFSDQVQSFFVDTKPGVPVETGLPMPSPRATSPTPSNSSEEVILFGGRDENGKVLSRGSKMAHTPMESINKKIRVIEDRIHEKEELLEEVLLGELGDRRKQPVRTAARDMSGQPSIEAKGFISNTPKHYGRNPGAIGNTNAQADEDALIADYIANIDNDDEFGPVNRRDLGGTRDDYWLPETESSSEEEARWNRDDIKDFDDLSTSDGAMGEIREILSKRSRQSGLQYLVVWDDQLVDEARWVLATTLSSINALSQIDNYEREERLSAEFMDKEDDGSDEYDGMSDEDTDDDEAVEADLVSKKIGRMSDLNIARLLAKQEELGMGSEEILLFDDEEDEGAQETDIPNSGFKPVMLRSRAKGRLRAPVQPRVGALTAGVLTDAYDGFDVMDFDRPSLKRRPKGRKGKLDFNVSDSELEQSMTTAWDNDRLRKKERKQEREALRAQGLLGAKNGKPVLKQKYKEGMGIYAVRDEIKQFLMGSNTTLSLPPMEKADRKVVHELANAFKLKSKSDGSGKKRHPVLYKTQQTRPFFEQTFTAVEARISRRFLPRMDVGGKKNGAARSRTGGGFSSAAVSYRDGDVVGGSAPELGAENRGRAMLEKMGWSNGTALGALNNKGILQPVSHVVKTTKAGLG